MVYLRLFGAWLGLRLIRRSWSESYYSLYLALQLKARVAGVPTPVYQRAEVHHTE